MEPAVAPKISKSFRFNKIFYNRYTLSKIIDREKSIFLADSSWFELLAQFFFVYFYFLLLFLLSLSNASNSTIHLGNQYSFLIRSLFYLQKNPRTASKTTIHSIHILFDLILLLYAEKVREK